MPLPKPRSGEAQAPFVSRCMSSDVMKRDFPSTAQRLAVCHSQFKKEAPTMEKTSFNADFELKTDTEGTFEGHAAIFSKEDVSTEMVDSHREASDTCTRFSEPC